MKYQIGNDTWEIIENDTNDYSTFFVRKNGEFYQTACGGDFETESGATYAILNEYSVEE